MALATFFCALVLLASQPGLWLFLLPAALPVLNLMPWSGWLMLDEFDLLALCALAAGYGRLAWERSPGPPPLPTHANRAPAVLTPSTAAAKSTEPANLPGLRLLIALFAVLSLVSALRGFGAHGFGDALAQLRETGLAQDYSGPLNSLRLVKSLVFALLLLPLLRRQMGAAGHADHADCAERAFKWAGAGVLTGLSVVVLVVLWERLAYPGLFNFSTRYRTTAMFWEMHVGGASIDAYFALATPFVAWALARSRTWRLWLPMAVLAVLTCYAVLTTFSRGVYVAVAVPLILLALGRWAQRFGLDWRRPLGQLWRRRATFWLIALLGLEITLVAAGGSFLADRVAQSQDDLDERLAHWRRGIGLLKSPTDWLLGIGLGRFPAEYASLGAESEFSGSLVLKRETPDAPQFQAVPPIAIAHPFVRLFGPASEPEIGGLFMLNQRVNVPVAQWLKRPATARAGAGYTVALEARVSGRSRVMVKVCEKHLLYEGECLARYMTFQGGPDTWQTMSLSLRGAGLQLDESSVPRSAVLSIAVFEPGVHLDIRRFQLFDPRGRPLVANADFSQGLAHWFPSAGSYYLPWHIDNLYLELLIERGLAGLSLFIMLIGTIMVRLAGVQANARREAAIVGAALLGALFLGLVSSVLDTPRVAFLLFFLIFLGNQWATTKRRI